MTIQKIGERLHEVMGWWHEALRLTRNGYLLAGKALWTLKKEKLWRKEIDHMPSFKYWVEHSLHISVAQAHRLIQIYETVGHLIEDIPIEVSKVTLLLPYLPEDDEEKRDMLKEASELTVEDVKNMVRELKGEADKCTDVCTHNDVETVLRCRNCGKWLKS